MRASCFRALLFLCFFNVLLSTTVAGKQIYVSWLGDDSNSGNSSFPFKQLSTAVAEALGGDTIVLEEGVYTDSVTVVVDKPLQFATASGKHDVVVTAPEGGGSIFTVVETSASFDGLTLDGQDGGGSLSCIVVTSSAVNLTGVSLFGCTSSTQGGAIAASQGSALLVVDCNFDSNIATGGKGGAISNEDGSTAVFSSSFSDNTASVASASAYGGAIYISNADSSLAAEVILSGCSFTYNKVTSTSTPTGSGCAGGAVYISNPHTSSTTTVHDCRFTDNTATTTSSDPDTFAYGGAIYISNPGTSLTTLVGTAFRHNRISVTYTYSRTNSAGALGGAVYIAHAASSTTTVSACAFQFNTAASTASAFQYAYSYGGGLYIAFGGSDSQATNFTGCLFTGNTASSTQYSWGGAVACTGSQSTSFASCVFVSNIASSSTTNSGTDASGGAIDLDGTVQLSDCMFSNNKAMGLLNAWGGAIRTQHLAVENLIFEGNAVQSSSAGALGGAIYTATAAMNNCTLTENSASSSSGSATSNGGAIYIASGTLSNCAFANNSALSVSSFSYGGAIYVTGSSTGLTMSTCTFASNVASSTSGSARGGALYIASSASGSQSVTNADDCAFSKNTALSSQRGGSAWGGAIYIASASSAGASITNAVDCTFQDNSASAAKPETCGGGCIYNAGITNVSLCRFTRNVARGRGGALSNSLVYYIYDSDFTSNSAIEGGAIYNIRGSDNAPTNNLTIVASSFRRNEERAIWMQDNGGWATLMCCTFNGDKNYGDDQIGVLECTMTFPSTSTSTSSSTLEITSTSPPTTSPTTTPAPTTPPTTTTFSITSTSVPTSTVAFLMLLVAIYFVNVLPRIRRAIRNRSLAELNRSSVGEDEPLSTEIVKVFAFYSQIISVLFGGNLIQRLLECKAHEMSGLECLLPSLISSDFFTEFLLYWLVPVWGFLVAVLIPVAEWAVNRTRSCCARRGRRSLADHPLSSDEEEEEDEDDFQQRPTAQRAETAAPLTVESMSRRTLNGFLFFCFLIYPTMTDNMIDVLKCYQADDVAELSCNLNTSSSFFPGGVMALLAVLTLFFFSGGLVALCSVLLYRARRNLRDQRTKARIGFLYWSYKLEFFWWEVPSFLQRLVIIFIANVLTAHSEAYLLSIGLMFLVFLSAQQWAKPYKSKLANWMEIFAMSSVLLLFFANEIAFALRIDGRVNINVMYFISSFDAFVTMCFIIALMLPTWRSLKRRFDACQRRQPEARRPVVHRVDSDSESEADSGNEITMADLLRDE